MADHNAGLLDRDDELSALAAGAAAAASGDGSLMVVEGAAGSGKTVLLAAARGLETSMLCLRACGSELEGDFAFGVVRQLLGGALAGFSSAARASLLASFPAARIAVGGAENAGSWPPATAPEVLHGLHQLVTGLAGQQPLQLLVDDAQWADLPSLRWLHYLRLRLDNLPVQVVVAVRTGGGPGLPDDLSFAGARRLSLRPFGRTTVGTLLRDRLVRDVPDAFVDGCLLATGGNPLFVMALIDEIAGQGLDRGLGAVPELGSAAVSRSVRRRLAALPVEATRYCEALAVLGNRRWPAALQQMAAVDAAAAQRSWAALVDAGILTAATASGFVHPIVRSSVRDGLATSRRDHLHREAAVHLRAGGATAEEVAAHLLRAPAASTDFAAETLRQAARTSAARGAPDIATTYLVRTLEEPLTPVERHEVLLALDQAAAATGDARAAEYLTAAVELAPTDAARVATVTVLAGVLYVLGDGQRAVQMLLREMGATSKARLRGSVENALFEMADSDLRLRPLVAGRKAQQPARTVLQHAHRAVELTIAGVDRDGAFASTRIALRGGELLDRHDMYFLLMTFLHSQHDRYDLAMQAYGRAIDAAQRRGSLFAAAVATAHRGRSRVYQGRLAEALADTERAWDQAVGGEWRSVVQIVAEGRAQALLAAGEAEAAGRVLQVVLEDNSVVRTTMDATALVTRGQVRARLGDLTGALDDLLTGGGHLVSWGLLNPAPYPWRSEAADVLRRLGRGDEALELAVEEVRLARRWGSARALGLALTTLGRVHRGPDGLRWLAEAVLVLDGSDSRLAWAEALVQNGASLRRQDMPGQARPALRQGLALAQQCGAAVLARRARTELWATGARPHPLESAGRSSLTAAERRVAELAGAGLANGAIAESLFVTVKTVETHLSSAYRKLGIHSRAELITSLSVDETLG